MELVNFEKHKDWVKVWSGRWSLHFDSHIGDDWTQTLTVGGSPIFQTVVYVYTNGITDCWVSLAEKDDLGRRFNTLVSANVTYLENLPNIFKAMADTVTSFLNLHDPRKLSQNECDNFWKLIGQYYLPHLSVKYIVDYLSPNVLEKYLPKLEEARLYAEPIFRNTENFWETFAEQIAQRTGYSKEMILATSKSELEEYFQNNVFPDKDVLLRRYEHSVLLVDRAQQQIYLSAGALNVERMLHPDTKTDFVKGQNAYKGYCKGIVRIIWNPTESALVFNEGDVLVTGMTRPEFLPFMKKAGAFVTDAGGILSHAAIMARELKKPCVIGTHVATKVLKDGDMVEVDADNGVVRILKR